MPPPEKTRRDLVLDRLREAAGEGVSHRQMLAELHFSPRPHIESLMFEGHGIAVFHGVDDKGCADTHYILRTDAWEGEQLPLDEGAAAA